MEENNIEEFKKNLMGYYASNSDNYGKVLSAYKQSRFYVEHSQWPFWGSFKLDKCFFEEIINHNRVMRAMIEGMTYLNHYSEKQLHASSLEYIALIKNTISRNFFLFGDRMDKSDEGVIQFVASLLAEIHDENNVEKCLSFLVKEFSKNEIN